MKPQWSPDHQSKGVFLVFSSTAGAFSLIRVKISALISFLRMGLQLLRTNL